MHKSTLLTYNFRSETPKSRDPYATGEPKSDTYLGPEKTINGKHKLCYETSAKIRDQQEQLSQIGRWYRQILCEKSVE